MKGLSIAKNLKQIVLADNQFLEEDDVLEAINDCMIKNQNLGRYDFKYNFISDYGKSNKIFNFFSEFHILNMYFITYNRCFENM